jgi:RNA polymerase-binding transcription factor
MNNLKTERLRRALQDKKLELLKRASSSLREMMADGQANDTGERKDEEDLTAFYQSEVMMCSQFEARREVIKKIDRALSMFNEGRYGICEECGEDIGERRLSAIPFALYCRGCQEERERSRRIKNLS